MSNINKNQKTILSKLGIEQLNKMQEETKLAIHAQSEVVLLSPTGTGKTLAFLLPIISEQDRGYSDIQTLILVPSRELAIQIEQVARNMGSGYKINTVYGGRPFSKDKMDLKHRPALLIGTPGRIADHIRRYTFSAEDIRFLVLDEFDKSLEVGFEEDMKEIMEAMPNLKKTILTSATANVDVPLFVGLKQPTIINYLKEGVPQLQVKTILSPNKDKLETLVDALSHIGNHPGIIFCNFKNDIERISSFLDAKKISHGCFHGGMEQKDRERALIKFRNGTHQIIIATDLAARGLDIPELKFIIHYHLPPRRTEFIHRNGRTARMNSDGTAYILQWEEEPLPDFITNSEVEEVTLAAMPSPTNWSTLFISGGRQDKISKGDIAGLFFKQGQLEKSELGVIELKKDCAFVAVPTTKVEALIEQFDNTRIKKRKVRVYEI